MSLGDPLGISDIMRRRGAAHALSAALFAFAAILVLDQVSKWWIVEGLNLRQRGVIEVLPSVLSFRMAWNDGVNFGLFGGSADTLRMPLVAFSVLFTIGLLFYARSASTQLQAAWLGVAAGGALGNAIDRITWGAVADFLNVSCCSIRNPWSFNIADIAIFVGLGLAFLFSQKKVDQSKESSRGV